MKLSKVQIESYRQQGFLLLENVVGADLLVELRAAIARFVEQSRQVAASNKVYDLDPSHSAAMPRVRRLKDPHLRDEVFQRLASSDTIVDPVCQLLGGTVRFDHSKLNFKHPHSAAEIAWHQDWAFYPHTNDDILAVGVMIEDCRLESGPLRVIPGSHRGPVYDHHHNGTFTGAIAEGDLGNLPDSAIDLVAPAGSISIHHVRTLHASTNCSADTTRPLLLFSYAAVDAFPVFSAYDLDEYDARILRGQAVRQGRMEALPIRLHLPQKPGADSIYDNQAVRKNGG
ncbi:MAG TPA: phytanoyl-CoA dioxygenase family protein [Gammaproteobacteria bacterium]|nr:phytanoyl-CoA dioxygenase family protein [Gammaproteobacteria bacterium]